MKTKKNRGAKTVLAACALCLLMLTGCGSDSNQSFSPQETGQTKNGVAEPEESRSAADNFQTETAGSTSVWGEDGSSTAYTPEDAEALLEEADAQGSIEELTEEGCRFAPYTVLEDSTMMVSQTEDAAGHLEEVRADGNTEYVVVHIDAGAGEAVSVERGDKNSLKEGDSVYIHGEMGADGIWMAKRIVVTVMN